MLLNSTQIYTQSNSRAPLAAYFLHTRAPVQNICVRESIEHIHTYLFWNHFASGNLTNFSTFIKMFKLKINTSRRDIIITSSFIIRAISRLSLPKRYIAALKYYKLWHWSALRCTIKWKRRRRWCVTAGRWHIIFPLKSKVTARAHNCGN